MPEYWIHKNNGKEIKIPLKDIEQLMNGCKCSKFEAVNIWLADHDFIVNQEQEELDKFAKSAKIADVRDKKRTKTSQKPREVKISSEKRELFDEIWSDLEDVYRNSVTVLKKYKLLEVKIGEKTFKVDIIEQRPPKN